MNPALAGSIGTIALEFAKEREAPMKELGEDYHLFGRQLTISCSQMELPKTVVVFMSRPIDQFGHGRQECSISPARGIFSSFSFGLLDEIYARAIMVGQKVCHSSGKESRVRLGRDFKISNIPVSVPQNDPCSILKCLRDRRRRRGDIEVFESELEYVCTISTDSMNEDTSSLQKDSTQHLSI